MAQQSAVETRERLLRAAIEVFAERGYDAATIREICRRADANVAAVHYHFGDKQRLYLSIFGTAFDLMRERRSAFLPPQAPPEERLRIYIKILFEEIFSFGGDSDSAAHLYRIYLAEMTQPSEMLDAVVSELFQRDADELYSIVGSLLGQEPECPTVIKCAASVVGQILYYYHAQPMIARLHRDKKPVSERIDDLAEHVWLFSLAAIRHLPSPLAAPSTLSDEDADQGC